MKAITTKFHGPTDTKGSRISASDCDGNRVYVPYDHARDTLGAHQKAVAAFLAKMDWPNGSWQPGAIKNGFAWVFIPADK